MNIFKKGDKTKCENYRPITKLSVLDKIFEQAILTRLQNHLIKHEIINANQYGFVKESITIAACLNCTEYIYENIEKGKFIAILSIDLSKAFDSTHIPTLINDLENINIRGRELQLFKTFLTNRKQFVKINDNISTIKNVHVGVPQGSKLAATLFILFINGIFNLKLKSKLQFYADDGLFKFVANSFDELIVDVKHDLNMIDQWCKEKFLNLNISITKLLIINNHKNEELNHFIGINYNGELIKSEKSIKYLGLVIDEKLNWTDHIKKN